MGSRYGGLKQIDPVGPNGETILDYSIYDALRAGFGKVAFVIRRDIEQAFQQAIGARFEGRVPVEYVFQELDKLPPRFSLPAGRTKPWGTTHAILMAAHAIHEPFAVINADDFYGAASYAVLAQQLQQDAKAYAMVGFILRNTLSDFGSVARGVCQVNDDGNLQSIVELTHIQRQGTAILNTSREAQITQLTGAELVSMNMWGFQPSVFPLLQAQFEYFLHENGSSLTAECYIPNSIGALIATQQAQVKVLETSDSWFGVTYRADRPHIVESLQQLIREGKYPDRLWP